MEYFIQQVINGVTLGSIYGLIAIGYTMVFGIIGMVNFAHGDVFMLSAFIALIFFLLLTQVLGVGSLIAALLIVLVLGMLMTSLWSWAIERLAYRPLRGSFRLAPLISAIGMSIFLMNLVQVTQGPRNKPVPPMLNDIVTLHEGANYSVTLSFKQMLIMVTTGRAAGVVLLPGAAHGARPRPARLRAGPAHGLPARRQRRPDHLAHVRDRGRAGGRRRGALHDPLRRGELRRWLRARREGLHRGGAGGHRIVARRGASAGLLIGLIETLWSAYFSIDYKDVATFAILVVTLVFLPSGILGRPEVEKV